MHCWNTKEIKNKIKQERIKSFLNEQRGNTDSFGSTRSIFSRQFFFWISSPVIELRVWMRESRFKVSQQGSKCNPVCPWKKPYKSHPLAWVTKGLKSKRENLISVISISPPRSPGTVGTFPPYAAAVLRPPRPVVTRLKILNGPGVELFPSQLRTGEAKTKHTIVPPVASI